jgi:hypothetical protein
MKVEKATIRVEACFDDSMKHKYYLKKSWDSKADSALVILLSAGRANGITMDITSMLTINNLSAKGIGSVEIMNLFTEIGVTINSKMLSDKKNIEENNKFMLAKAKACDKVILAWGRGGSTSKTIQERIYQVMELLADFKQKTFILCDADDREYFHPLAPQVRHNWNLKAIK